ncbi:Sodium channel and clathrin linker 1 [Oopsacas minuta]|uniref:Sodium channel and clathrin linker 1 n=1 Tax=Oopsacas minuta TaxID=111878 RepID=A0AAV7JS63_9METZ|nr:Sodium channel and clathrin linker 1 [Oopsacas minuta]
MKSHIQQRAMLLSEQKKEIMALQEQRAELEHSLMANSRKLASLESREQEAVRHVKESIDMVEVAMIEKNQAMMKAQQANSEIDRLNDTLVQLVEEVGHKTKQGVDEVRLECNQSISNMAREIRSLEDEAQARETEFEKVLKEKQNSQKDLERLKRGYLSQNLEAIHQLQQRLSSVELERETAILKMEGIYSDYLQVREQLDQEQKLTQTDKQNNKQRQESLHSQIQAQKQDQLRLSRQVEELKTNLKESNLNLETCERKYMQKLQSLSNQFRAKEAELQAKFEGTESCHRETTNELRNLLSSHQRLGAKWRGETKTITDRFENATKKLKEENSKLKRTNEELKGEVVQSKFEQQSVSIKLKNLESQRDNFQNRIDELEDRNDQYTQQLTKYMTKERQWEQEQKILNNHLTRLQLQSSHSQLKTKNTRIMTAPSNKFKLPTSEYISSANLPPPLFFSSSSIHRVTQSPNVLSEPFLHLDSYSNCDTTLSNQTDAD